MGFGDRLIKVRKEHGYTREALAQELGISKFTLRNYELEATEPGHTFLKQISDFFHVSVDYLMELTDEQEILETFRIRSSEKDSIEKYRTLDTHGKDMVDTVLEKEYSRCISVSKPKITPISEHGLNDDNCKKEKLKDLVARSGNVLSKDDMDLLEDILDGLYEDKE